MITFQTSFVNSFDSLYIIAGFDNEFTLIISQNCLVDLSFLLFSFSIFSKFIFLDLICYEIPNTCISYLFKNLYFNYNFVVNSIIFKNIYSISNIFKNANWVERLASDMFGINFLGLVNFRRLMLDYSFIGYPLKKSFPLIGFLESWYSEVEKKVIYLFVSNVDLFRIFIAEKVWN